MRLFVTMLVGMVVMATLIDDSEGYHLRSSVADNDVSDVWKQVATHTNGLPYNPLGSPMFVAPRPTDQKAIDLMCSFIQETPSLPNVEHDEEDVTTPNWDRLYADRSQDVAECCRLEGDEQELCIEILRQKNVDQYCYFWAHSFENGLGINDPCCEEVMEGRVQCMDQARYGFDSDIHDEDMSIQLLQVTVIQRLRQLLEKNRRLPAFDHRFCNWAKQQAFLDTTFEEAAFQRMDPMQKNSEMTRKLISCCDINTDEATIDQCMASVREDSLDKLCWEEKALDVGSSLIDPSFISNFPVGLKAIMAYKDDIPAHPCCQKSHTNRYSCFSQEWAGFKASRDPYDHTEEIAQYKEKYDQLKSKIAMKLDSSGQGDMACGYWYGGKVLPESVEEIKPLSLPELQGAPHLDLFQEFTVQHNKTYQSHDEYVKRYYVFQNNLKRAAMLQESEQGTAKYGVTQFMDLTEEEFRKFYLSPVWDPSPLKQLPKAIIPDIEAPDSIDWREKNAVTGVKNQGQCGSYWAFATTANIEGRWAIKNRSLLPLSEQMLVDCDKVDMGCNGGLPFQAYAEIMRLGGMMLEADYPYTAREGQCKFDKSKVQVDITGREKVSTDEAKIAAYVAANGPVSAGLNAAAMQFYEGGVSHPWSFLCSPSGIDHGVAIVGYGTDTSSSKPYWLIKNSWGTGWGEKGYYRLYRGDGTCGVNQMVTSAII